MGCMRFYLGRERRGGGGGRTNIRVESFAVVWCEDCVEADLEVASHFETSCVFRCGELAEFVLADCGRNTKFEFMS